MKSLLPGLTALLIIALAGYGHGVMTGRWGNSTMLAESVLRIPNVPTEVGEWKGEDIPPSEDQKAQYKRAELVGAVVRRYVHRPTGDAVMVMILSGLPGPIATHSPEACYKGQGYELAAPASKLSVSPGGGRPDSEFWFGDFRIPGELRPGLRFAWSWRAGDAWEAVDNPRSKFAPYPGLYKIYVIREVATSAKRIDEDPKIKTDDPVAQFLKVLLPGLNAALFEDPPPSAAQKSSGGAPAPRAATQQSAASVGNAR
jgi:hypothetical protein